MARAAVKKTQRRKPRRKRKAQSSGINIRGLLFKLVLLGFLFFSIGMLAYVIFFRVVVATEPPPSAHNQIIIEERGSFVKIPPGYNAEETLSRLVLTDFLFSKKRQKCS